MAYATTQRQSDVESIKSFLNAVQSARSVSNTDLNNRNNDRVKKFAIGTHLFAAKFISLRNYDGGVRALLKDIVAVTSSEIIQVLDHCWIDASFLADGIETEKNVPVMVQGSTSTYSDQSGNRKWKLSPISLEIIGTEFKSHFSSREMKTVINATAIANYLTRNKAPRLLNEQIWIKANNQTFRSMIRFAHFEEPQLLSVLQEASSYTNIDWDLVEQLELQNNGPTVGAPSVEEDFSQEILDALELAEFMILDAKDVDLFDVEYELNDHIDLIAAFDETLETATMISKLRETLNQIERQSY